MYAPMLKNIPQFVAKTFGRRVSLAVFVIATLTAAAVLVLMVGIPQWLSKEARWEALRLHVGEIGQVAASVVDGDLHRQLLDPPNYSDDLYSKALKPLVRLHSSYPGIFYLYTMVDSGGVAYFILDTAASPELRTTHKLRASEYMERFDLGDQPEDDWLQQIAAGKTYVTPTFEHDEYGDFLTAHVPIYDSAGTYSGFVGADFDLQYYFASEASFRNIAIGSSAGVLIASLVIGYLIASYHSLMHDRMQELYDISMHDGLTGLLNRRGALDQIGKLLESKDASNATLLVDIDNLKMINDVRGHATGDAVIAITGEAIRKSVREGDVCARVGGDEFLIFAPDCDAKEATEIANRTLASIERSMPLAGAKCSVSIGITVQERSKADFALMYQEADMALYQGREDGRGGIGIFEPSGAAPASPF